MNAASFIKEAGELCRLLERFQITKSRSCAVTLHSGDGTLISFDRSDRPSAPLHESVRCAFNGDELIMSYEPIHPLYGELPRFENSLFDDVSALREASRRLKAFLYSRAREIAPTEETDSAFHVLMTDRGAVVGGRDLKDLEKNVLRLEQYVRKIAILSTIRRDVIKNGGPVVEMFDNLEMMERGSIYISERK